VEAETSIKTTPPLPGKKPNVPVKKSPSNSGSSGSLFHGLKKRFVDVIDGGGGSKMSPPKIEPGESSTNDNAFDDVHRRPLLQDVRASRPKAPGIFLILLSMFFINHIPPDLSEIWCNF
jgi:hypothetical protein